MKPKARTTDAKPGSTEWLAQRQIVWDPTGMGRARFTHEPTGRAVIKQPYMSEDDWEAAKIEFGLQAERGELRA